MIYRICDICNKSFKSKYNRLFIITNSGEKKETCEKCYEEFKRGVLNNDKNDNKEYTMDEIINTLRYKAENIKAHIEPEFFNMVAACMEEFKELLEKKQQLTVYNVDKVVEKLEEQISKHDLLFNKYVKDKDKSCSWSISELNKIRGLLEAIDIVKRGGIDE